MTDELPYEEYPVKERDCRRCRFAGSDPDGGFCGHPISLGESGGFGRSWTAARREGEFCGPEGKLWKPMSEKRKKALGISS